MSTPVNASRSQVETALRELERRLRNKGTVTLRTGETTTVVSDPRIHHSLDVFLTPQTQAAGEAVWWVASIERGKFTIGHPANAVTSRTFAWMLA